jgi:hypothetical protein
MSNSDLSAEYANIKAYCRKEAAKSFKHPLAPKPTEAQPAPEAGGEAEQAASELSDAELDSMLQEG